MEGSCFISLLIYHSALRAVYRKNHYFDSNVDMREYNLIPGQAQALYDVMREWKIG